MQSLTKVTICVFISLLCLSSVWAEDLKTCVDAYQKSVDEIRRSSQTGFEKIQQIYGNELETQKAAFQRKGDLRKTKALFAESERFQKTRLLPFAPDENEIPEIKNLQAGYVKRYSMLEKDLIQKLRSRTLQYENELTRLLKELTIAGKLDAATEVETEQKKAQSEIKNFTEQLAALNEGSAADANLALNERVSATAAAMSASKANLYMVVDLSDGPSAVKYPVSYLSDVPKGGWTDEYKTEKLVLRRIEPGTFVMGSPEDELGRKGDETQHEITLTKIFYIGVFEVTQKQWERVMGGWPSFFKNDECRDTRPVEQVSYDGIRGAIEGAKWPAGIDVDAASFMGRLRSRTDKAFDLPTESQWECACRSGTSTAVNNGKMLTAIENCPNMSEVGRYLYLNIGGNNKQHGDTSVGTAKVGSYLNNFCGLYDMSGNALEWCLDWYGEYPDKAIDPKGATTGTQRVVRGGGWGNTARCCRSAARRGIGSSSALYFTGFRVACVLDSATPTERVDARPPDLKGADDQPVVSKPVEQDVPSTKGNKITLNLDAKPGKRGGNTKSSYAKVRNLTCDIAIRLTSFDVKQVEAQVKVYFVGKDGDGRRLVADWQEKTITLDQSKGWSESVTSKDIREQTPHYYYYYYNDSRRWVSGAKLEGWIVQVWIGGQLIAKKASLNPLLRYENVMKEMGLMQERIGGGTDE